MHPTSNPESSTGLSACMYLSFFMSCFLFVSFLFMCLLLFLFPFSLVPVLIFFCCFFCPVLPLRSSQIESHTHDKLAIIHPRRAAGETFNTRCLPACTGNCPAHMPWTPLGAASTRHKSPCAPTNEPPTLKGAPRPKQKFVSASSPSFRQGSTSWPPFFLMICFANKHKNGRKTLVPEWLLGPLNLSLQPPSPTSPLRSSTST